MNRELVGVRDYSHSATFSTLRSGVPFSTLDKWFASFSHRLQRPQISTQLGCSCEFVAILTTSATRPPPMRLLNVHDMRFYEAPPDRLPSYSIVSHRWSNDNEISYKDVCAGRNTNSEGYRKVVRLAEYAKQHLNEISYMWIDTCCIDQESKAEVAEAINSMYEWYSAAKICLVYLADVTTSDTQSFGRSAWFTRGWTLQELISPRTAVFLTRDLQVLGHKGGTGRKTIVASSTLGPCLLSDVAAITGLPEILLHRSDQLFRYNVTERLSWANGRTTTRKEDMAYCLLGVLGVRMPITYGEGGPNARRRLLAALGRCEEELTIPSAAIKLVPSPQRQPRSNVPLRRNPSFVGREAILSQISQNLDAPASRSVLVGLGGIGKSQIALEYAYRRREQSTSIFWIQADNATRTKQGLLDVAFLIKERIESKPDDEMLEIVRDWLYDRRNGKWLIVFDNVDESEALDIFDTTIKKESPLHGTDRTLFSFLPVCDHGSILITTRSKHVASKVVADSDILIVNPMDASEATMMLGRGLGLETMNADVHELATRLDCIPLALNQAATYIKRSTSSARDYLDQLQKTEMSERNLLGVGIQDRRRGRPAQDSILATWQTSFERIKQVRRSAATVLCLMSLCDWQAIPEALLRGGIRRRHYKSESDMLWCDDSSTNTKLELLQNDDFEKDILLLEAYSFVSLTQDPHCFKTIRLVQVATRAWLRSQKQLESWRERHIENLGALFPPGRYENWELCRALYPHVQSLAASRPQSRTSLLHWASIMHNAAWFTWAIGHAREAEALSLLCFTARTKELGNDHLDTLMSKEMTALTKKSSGKVGEAEHLFLEVIEASERAFGKEHPSTLTSVSNLASTYQTQGLWEEAQAMHEHVLECYVKISGLKHPDTLAAMDNLALAMHARGKYLEAEDMGRQALAGRVDVLGAEHPHTITSQDNLALVLQSQGRYEEAETLMWRARGSYIKVLGVEHPHTLTNTSNLASVLRQQGRYEEAESLSLRALEGRERCLGKEHPDTLTSMSSLASIYRCQGKYAEAEELHLRALASREKILGSMHPDTLASLSKLSSVFRDQGRYADAGRMAGRVCEGYMTTLGDQHPHTLTSMSNLASLLQDQGIYGKAEALQVQVLESRQRVLGEEHPDTLQSVYCLVQLRHRMQNRSAAPALHERTCARSADDQNWIVVRNRECLDEEMLQSGLQCDTGMTPETACDDDGDL